MPTPEWHLARAYRRLGAARSLLNDGFAEDAYNRLYYAALEGARSALRSLDVDPPKTHRGVRALLHRHVLAEGRLPELVGTVLDRMEGPRISADYSGLDDANVEDARVAFHEVVSFIDAIREEFVAGFDASDAPTSYGDLKEQNGPSP